MKSCSFPHWSLQALRKSLTGANFCAFCTLLGTSNPKYGTDILAKLPVKAILDTQRHLYSIIKSRLGFHITIESSRIAETIYINTTIETATVQYQRTTSAVGNCVHFCQPRHAHWDPELHINRDKIPVLEEKSFWGFILTVS